MPGPHLMSVLPRLPPWSRSGRIQTDESAEPCSSYRPRCGPERPSYSLLLPVKATARSGGHQSGHPSHPRRSLSAWLQPELFSFERAVPHSSERCTIGSVPYKSKGCNTCGRRKVKVPDSATRFQILGVPIQSPIECDEIKPECMRCIKNGHICPGYERNRVFIIHSSTDSAKALVRRPRQSVVSTGSAIIRPADVDPGIPQFNVNSGVRTHLSRILSIVSHHPLRFSMAGHWGESISRIHLLSSLETARCWIKQ